MIEICEIRNKAKPKVPEPLDKEVYNAYMENPKDRELAKKVGQAIVDIHRYDDYISRQLRPENPHANEELNKARYDCGKWFIVGVEKTMTCADGLVTMRYEDFHRGEDIVANVEYPLGFIVEFDPEQRLKVIKNTVLRFHFDSKLDKINDKINELFKEEDRVRSERIKFAKLTYEDL